MTKCGCKLRQVLFLFMGALILFLSACEEEKTRMVYELNEFDNLSAATYGPFSEMIDEQFSYLKYVVIRQETDTAVNRQMCYELMHSDTTSLNDSIINNYEGANEASLNLDFKFETIPEVRLITREELNSYEDWEGFHSNHPGAKGVIILNLPGFNDDSTKALFEYSWRAGNTTDGDYIVYLEKGQGVWQIAAHEPAGTSGSPCPASPPP